MASIPVSSRQAAPSLRALCCSHSPLSPPHLHSSLLPGLPFCHEGLFSRPGTGAPLHLLPVEQWSCPSPCPGLDGDFSGHVQGSLAVIQQKCRQVRYKFKPLLGFGQQRSRGTAGNRFPALWSHEQCRALWEQGEVITKVELLREDRWARLGRGLEAAWGQKKATFPFTKTHHHGIFFSRRGCSLAPSTTGILSYSPWPREFITIHTSYRSVLRHTSVILKVSEVFQWAVLLTQLTPCWFPSPCPKIHFFHWISIFHLSVPSIRISVPWYLEPDRSATPANTAKL